MVKARHSMKPLRALMALMSMLVAVPACADSDPDDFQVTVSVVPSCKFIIAVDVAFGNLDVYGFGTKTAFGNLKVLCTKAGAYTIDLNDGLTPDLSGNRQMSDGGISVIPYELYRDENTTQVWKSGVDTLAFTGSGLREEKRIYGVLTWTEEMLPNAPVGNYADTVTATVNF